MKAETNTSAEPASGSPPEDAQPDQLHSVCASSDLAEQLERIHAHRAASQHDSNRLTAVLRCVNSDLMDVEACIGQTLRQELLEGQLTMEEVHQASPAIDLMIRLTRQIAQLSELETRFTLVESDLGKIKPR